MKSAPRAIASLWIAASTWVPAASADPRPPDLAAVDRPTHLKTLERLLDDVEEIEDKNEDNPDKRLRKAIRDRLEDMRKDLEAAKEDLQAAPPAGGIDPAPPPVGLVPVPVPSPAALVLAPLPPPAPTPPPEPVEMSGSDFASFLAEIRKATYASDKLSVVKEVVADNHFTVAQVVQVMNTLTYSIDKVHAASAMYPKVVDKQSWFKVYSALTYSSDKEELRKRTSAN